MSFSSVTVLNEKLSSLPEGIRERVAAYISDHFEELEDEMKWDENFKRTASSLSDFAEDIRQQVAEGKAEEMDFDKL